MTDSRNDTASPAPVVSLKLFLVLAALLVTAQLLLGLWGADDYFTRGHNGFNSSAYLQSARNTLRWHALFPHQYYTENVPPLKTDAYTHAPLGLHLHNVAAVWLIGDRELAVHGVAALHGALVVLALIYLVSQHWSRAHALAAGAIYVALPINAIFVNMVNHTGGFLLWSLGMLHCYLRYRDTRGARWLVGLFACSWLATFWDWPAYYVAFFIAVHWFVTDVKARVTGKSTTTLSQFVLPFAGFCIWILLTIAMFFGVIKLAIGSVADLMGTYSARQVTDPNAFTRAVQQVPKLMFTYPVLIACAAWLFHYVLRLFTGKARARDLIPISYGISGVLHFFIFRSSSVVHEYWLWPLLPFVAIALADIAVSGFLVAKRVAANITFGPVLQPGIVLVSALPALYVIIHSVQLTPMGRQVGGSTWFFHTTRQDSPEFYDSGRPELHFAAKVRSWTTRSTAVLVHNSFERFRPEPRFDITLDRPLRRAYSDRPRALPKAEGIDGTVFIAALADFSLQAVAALAAKHPVTIYDHYMMADLRSEKSSVRVIELKRAQGRSLYRFFASPFEPAWDEVRSAEREAEITQLAQQLPR